MRVIMVLSAIVGLSAITGCGGAPAPNAAEGSSKGTPATPDKAKATQHLREHVKYPATRTQVLEACANTPEFSVEERAWFAEKLPEGTYASADDVLKALGL